MVEEEKKDMIAEANAAAEKLREEREKLEKLHKEMQEARTRDILGGKTIAGETQKPEVTHEEKLKSDLKEYWKGSSVERYIK